MKWIQFLFIIISFSYQLFSQSSGDNDYIAELWVSKNIVLPSKDTSYVIQSFMYLEKVNKFSPFKATNIGNVTFNDSLLHYNPNTQSYFNSFWVKDIKNVKWGIQSSNVVISDNVSAFPSIKEINFIPDTINRKKALVILLKDLQNTSGVEWLIDDQKVHLTAPWNKSLLFPNLIKHCTINLSTHELSLLDPTENAVVRVVILNKKLVAINGNKYLIIYKLVLIKRVIII